MLVGLAQVANDILSEISSKERQMLSLETSNAPKEKLKRLGEELEELSTCKTMLEEEMDNLINSFFIHRQRDTHPEIR
jgi:hypothetical protein